MHNIKHRLSFFILVLALSVFPANLYAQISNGIAVVSGTLQNGATANGNGTVLSVRGLSAAMVTVNCSVACSGGTTINFEVSEDGTNFSAVSGQQIGTNTIATTVLNQGTTPTIWEANVAGTQSLRARISGYIAGTVTVTATAIPAPFNPKVVNDNLLVGGLAVDGNSGAKSSQTVRMVLATDQPALTNKLLVTPDSIALPANQSINAAQVGGTATDTNSGIKSAGTLRIVLATDQPALTNKLLVTPDSVALPANQSVNAAQIAGTTTDTNSGVKSAGTLRVVLATDQPALTNKLLVTPDSVALPANQSVNTSQINGVTTLMGNGVTGTGSQRVTIASDNTAFAVNSTLSAETTKVIGTTRLVGNVGGVIDAAPAATAPANLVQVGGQFVTAPATLTTGQGGALQLTAAQNLKTDMTTVAGTATSTAAAGTQKVGIVGNAAAALDAATGAAPPANAILRAGLGSGATGGLLLAMPVCDSFANINIGTAATTLLVTGVAGRHVRVCSLNMITALANNVAIISGTGATCGTGSAAIVGTTAATGYNFAAGGGFALGSGLGPVMRTVATGDSVCFITSAATQLSGVVAYTIY